MKKLLFPLILTVTGNPFTAPKPQKTKSTRNSIASRILESEKKRDWGSSSKRNKTFCRLCYKLWNYGSKKKYWRRGIWTIFWKDYIISDVLKKEIGKWQVEDLGYTNTFN